MSLLGWKTDGSRRNKRPATPPCTPANSDHADVLGLRALPAGRNVELDALTLFEGLVTVALDVRKVNEDVIFLFTRDEAEALVCVEELDGTLCHEYSFLIQFLIADG